MSSSNKFAVLIYWEPTGNHMSVMLMVGLLSKGTQNTGLIARKSCRKKYFCSFSHIWSKNKQNTMNDFQCRLKIHIYHHCIRYLRINKNSFDQLSQYSDMEIVPQNSNWNLKQANQNSFSFSMTQNNSRLRSKMRIAWQSFLKLH